MNVKTTELKPTSIMKEVIYITTPRIGFIPMLRMQGPIVTPIPATRETAKAMVVAGIKTYMIDKDKNVTELNLKNVYPGEGDKEDSEDDKKNTTPVSGVVNQEPVKPVELGGVVAEQKKENTNFEDSDSSISSFSELESPSSSSKEKEETNHTENKEKKNSEGTTKEKKEHTKNDSTKESNKSSDKKEDEKK